MKRKPTLFVTEDEDPFFTKVCRNWWFTGSLSRYYKVLNHRYERRFVWYAAIFVSLVSAAFFIGVYNPTSGTAGSGMRPYRFWAPPLLVLVLAVATIWQNPLSWPRRSALSAILSDECRGLNRRWCALWIDILAADEYSKYHHNCYVKLVRKLDEVSRKAVEYGIYNERLYRACIGEEHEPHEGQPVPDKPQFRIHT